jgi:hypothetical protein
MLVGIVVTYSDLNVPNDVRADKSVPFLWVPGAVVAVIGVASSPGDGGAVRTPTD